MHTLVKILRYFSVCLKLLSHELQSYQSGQLEIKQTFSHIILFLGHMVFLDQVELLE